MRKSTIIILILACVGCINAFAQQKPSYEYYRQWYLGKDGGIPFGMSTFSSFGEGPNKLGWSAGMYGGYHFNSFLSVEAFMLTGKVKQTTQKQFESFWLLPDGSCMLHEPEYGNGWKFSNLKTDVKIQTYGFRANINMLGFFDRTKASRWAVNISPLLGLVGTKASYRTLDHNEKIKKRDTDWHFGAGGNLGAEFKITHHFSVGIYSGITFITGQSISGLPKFGHKENYFWESGVRLNVIFGKSVLKEAEREIKRVEKWMHRRPVEEANVLVVDPATDQVEEVYTMLEFPIIDFPSNSELIDHNQAHKINKIVRLMKKNPNTKVVITGYADDASNKDRCQRRATQRAKAVQRQLLQSGINPEVITIAVGDDNDLQQKGNCVIIDKWEK